MITESSISYLPSEIIMHIFSFLHPKQMSQVACVCKLWEKLAKDNSFWGPVFKEKYPNYYLKWGEQQNCYHHYKILMGGFSAVTKLDKFTDEKIEGLCSQGNVVVTTSQNAFATIWKITADTVQKFATIEMNGGPLSKIAIHKSILIAEDSNNCFLIKDLDKAEASFKIQKSSKSQWCSDKNFLLINTKHNYSLEIWNVEEKKKVYTNENLMPCSWSFIHEEHLISIKVTNDVVVQNWQQYTAAKVFHINQGGIIQAAKVKEELLFFCTPHFIEIWNWKTQELKRHVSPQTVFGDDFYFCFSIERDIDCNEQYCAIQTKIQAKKSSESFNNYFDIIDWNNSKTVPFPISNKTSITNVGIMQNCVIYGTLEGQIRIWKMNNEKSI